MVSCCPATAWQMTILFRDVDSTCLDGSHDTQSKDMAQRDTVVVSREFESLMIGSCCSFIVPVKNLW